MRFLARLLAAALVTGCAATTTQSAFEFRPRDVPLRYRIKTEERTVVETPAGADESHNTLEVTVRLEIRPGKADVLHATAVFEAFEASASGPVGGTVEDGDLVGLRYTGTLEPNGQIALAEGLETPESVEAFFDPRAFLAELLMPLPPAEHRGAASWPVHWENTFNTALSVRSALHGTARVVGDTTWGGMKARLIELEGETDLWGRGTPLGGTTEIELAATGSATARFLCDVARGVMLYAAWEGQFSGNITVPGTDVTIPVQVTSTQTTELAR
ncbi:MAG: hypothetical protein GTN78_22455 [Gemmatimonadales bacterium]|nr:hypothetical protein [Gemmatimonadales bacterium]NIR02929.1 hypothetical protein [Gemmatimonadales bacterium]